jgi:hypothetical protein
MLHIQHRVKPVLRRGANSGRADVSLAGLAAAATSGVLEQPGPDGCPDSLASGARRRY